MIFKWKKQGRIKTERREYKGKMVLYVLDEHPPEPAPRGTLTHEQLSGDDAPAARVHSLPFKVTKALIRRARLSAKELYVARKRFMLAQPWTLEEIADMWRVSRQAIWQVEKSARTKLYGALYHVTKERKKKKA